MSLAGSPPTDNVDDAQPIRSADDQELLKQLDACVDRMRAHISDEPYILTIPQDEPKFHHYSRHAADAWLQDTPFGPNENYQVQYQTFFYREPYSDLFERVRSSHFDRNPMLSVAQDNAQSRSRTTTPSIGPKKKISLAAYNKNKQAQGATSNPSDKRPQSRLENGVEDSTKTCEKENAKQSQPKISTDKNAVAKNDMPRDAPAHNTLKRKPAQGSTESTHANTSNQLKKPRLDAPPPSKSEAHSPQTQGRSKDSRKQSSTFPKGRLSPLNPLYLPGRLSPTLPPQLVAALDGVHHSRSISDSSTESAQKTGAPRPGSKHDSVLSHANDHAAEHVLQGLPKKEKGSAPGKNESTREPIKREKELEPVKKEIAPESGKNETMPEVLKKENKHDNAPAPVKKDTGSDSQKASDDKANDEKPPSLVFVIRIPKSKRVNLRRQLQLPPAPTIQKAPKVSSPKHISSGIPSAKQQAKPASEKRIPQPSEEPLKGLARKASASSRNQDKAHLPTPTSAPSTKRPLSSIGESSQPSAKRAKAPLTLNVERHPSTPVQPDFRSPALPHSATKSHQATPTPRKDLRTSVAMKRVESNDSLSIATPRIHDRTPVSSQATAGAQRPPQSSSSNTKPSPSSSSSSAKSPEFRAWWAEYNRFSSLARELKHAIPRESDTLSKRSALTHLESFLAFVLAFYCHDNAYLIGVHPPQPPSIQNWKSCEAFWLTVRRACQPFPHLCGLALYLGAVFNGVIMRRIVSTRLNDPETLQSSTAAAFRAVDEAARLLPLTVIESEYKRTWGLGVSSSKDGSPPAAVLGHYDGGFALNVGLHTDPLEAVRFARSLMGEWCDSGRVEYKMKLELSPARNRASS